LSVFQIDKTAKTGKLEKEVKLEQLDGKPALSDSEDDTSDV